MQGVGFAEIVVGQDNPFGPGSDGDQFPKRVHRKPKAAAKLGPMLLGCI